MKALISNLLLQAAHTLVADADSLHIILERPKSAAHGDFSCNLAMMLAKPLRQNPRAIAEQLIQALPPNDQIEKVEVAGAGFINFYLANNTKHAGVQAILQAGDHYGHNQ